MSSQTPAYNSRFIYILMFFVAFFWGLAWPVGRILATDLLSYPYSVMFFRYLFAIPVLFGWLWRPIHTTGCSKRRSAPVPDESIAIRSIRVPQDGVEGRVR